MTYEELHSIWLRHYLYKRNGKVVGIDMSIKRTDYDELKKYVEDKDVKSVLEFGSGMSTLCFVNIGCSVLSFEDQEWVYEALKKIKGMWYPKAAILKHSGVMPYAIPKDAKFDMAFIDGPWSRTGQASVAYDHTDAMWIHDTECECCWETLRFLRFAGWHMEKMIDNDQFGMQLWRR